MLESFRSRFAEIPGLMAFHEKAGWSQVGSLLGKVFFAS
jgi:hypothetical protein